MDEVFKYQESIEETLASANKRLQQVELDTDIDGVLSNAKDYHAKITNIRKSIYLLRDKSSMLRKRAIKLIEEKNREDIERQRVKERREMLERHLDPVVDNE